MEILNLKKRAGGFVALCSLVILIILLAVLPLESGIVASADNQDIIGSGGGYIEIADVTAGLVSATYSSAKTGRTLKITMPKSTVNVYFAYEVDSSEQVWAIKGDADIDDDIPYLTHEGKMDKFEVSTKTLGKVESSWSDVTIVNDKKVFTVTVHFNGTLYVECLPEGETNRLSNSHLVKDVDCLSPKMQTGIIANGLRNEQNQAIFECSSTFVDGVNEGTIASARSGLQEVLIIRTDVALSDMTEESVENANVETVLSWEPLTPTQVILSQKVTFTIDKDGYYYYFVVDRVGNIQINEMLGGKFSREDHSETDSRFDVFDKWAGSSGATYSVKNYMIQIGEELSEYDGKVQSKVYTDALEAYSTLLLRFYSGESQTNREGISNAYFSFFNNEYTTFKNAFSVGATFTSSLVNGDLMGNVTLHGLNFNKETVPSLGGDDVRATFTVAKYSGTELPTALQSEIGDLKGVGAYKLAYTLTVSGVQSTVPNTPVGFELIGFDSNQKNFTIYLKTDSGFIKPEQIQMENGIRFSTALNGAEYYLVYTETDPATDLLWLWITLGVVGGAGMGVGFFFLGRKIMQNAKCKMQNEPRSAQSEEESK